VAGKADLHMHSHHSDGAFAPAEVVKKAHAAGISIVSITDHDTVNGIEEARQAAEQLNIEVIPGIELSAFIDDREIHILGYFINPAHERLLESLVGYREQRLRRAERIVSKLNKMNIPLSMDSVLEQAGEGAVGRVHIANAMVNDGHADTYSQAFSRYLGDGRPAYERKTEVTPEQTIKLIAEAGGISVVAHPGKMLEEQDLARLIEAGLDGIEVVHPSHSYDTVQFYRKVVNEYFLVESGGSDFHGGARGDENNIGRVTIGVECVGEMRQRLFSRTDLP
jgi:predicted metal-dependent phosphoesterase TrpH